MSRHLYGGLNKLLISNYYDAYQMYIKGYVSDRAFDWYLLFYELGGWRVSSDRQARVYNRIGLERFKRRMDRVKKLEQCIVGRMDRDEPILGLSQVRPCRSVYAGSVYPTESE